MQETGDSLLNGKRCVLYTRKTSTARNTRLCKKADNVTIQYHVKQGKNNGLKIIPTADPP